MISIFPTGVQLPNGLSALFTPRSGPRALQFYEMFQRPKFPTWCAFLSEVPEIPGKASVSCNQTLISDTVSLILTSSFSIPSPCFYAGSLCSPTLPFWTTVSLSSLQIYTYALQNNISVNNRWCVVVFLWDYIVTEKFLLLSDILAVLTSQLDVLLMFMVMLAGTHLFNLI